MTDIFPGSGLMVQGEVPRGLFLLVGPPGVGKSVFCREFIRHGLETAEPCIYFISDDDPQYAKENMLSLGFNAEPYEEKGLLTFIDCYTYRTGETKSASKYFIQTPANLSDVSITIEKARAGLSNYRFVLDSISILAEAAGPGAGRKFMQTLTARMQKAGRGVCTLELGVHEESFMTFLRFLFDGVLEMKVEEEEGGLKRWVRAFSVKGAKHVTTWFRFDITEKGVAVYPP